MKILFLTKNKKSASFIFYKESFELLKQIDKSIFINYEYPEDPNEYKVYDFVFFMGGSENAKEIKSYNKNIKCILIDSRSLHEDKFDSIDLVISNGLENYLYHMNKVKKNLIYPTYPRVYENNILKKNNENNQKIILGYHGNKIHLNSMNPKILNAIKEISKEFKIELWAMYNVKNLGKSKIFDRHNKYFKVKHIQYSHENYHNYIAKVDIGLVPQLIPQNNNFFSNILSIGFKNFNQSKTDYLLRFKDTTNLGRHFVFSQLKIPFVSDITPSSVSYIKHGYNGFLAYTEKNWYDCILMLIKDKKLRKKIGQQSFQDWYNSFSHNILNKQLLKILNEI